ncbi:Peptidyl-prolyl cis-trans isomerase pin4 [Xanthoria parietina]
MNGHQNSHDMYYDPSASRSPGAQRHQQPTLHRQPSRQFDAYAQMQNAQMQNPIYQPEDTTARFDGNRFDRINPTMQGAAYGYEIPSAQTWNPNAFAGPNGFPAFGATGRMRPAPRGRSALPPTWLDQQQMNNGGTYGPLGPSPLGMSQIRSDQFGDQDDDLIPTAIVIKNIPFAVKKEQLVELMTNMNLPLPYAFNYHFDNGVFRGLAFANFTTSDETQLVIDHLNHFELQGRKLRVEYKKMLPLQERERIEREKRERRGQLEEQHRPLALPQLQNQPSMSSMSSHVPTTSPSPIGSRIEKPDVDLNDPKNLEFYNEVLVFKNDPSRGELNFPTELTPQERRIVHTLAHNMGLCHSSHDTADNQRYVAVYRTSSSNISPPVPQGSYLDRDPNHRALNRAQTMEFKEARGREPGMYPTLRGQQSSGLLGVPPDSPGVFGTQSNLRGAKSVADLRAKTPSPAISWQNFPSQLATTAARYQQQQDLYGVGNASSATPTLTPTASASALGQHRSDDMLVNGMNGMSINGSPRRLRGMFPWDQDSQSSVGGPIGSNRSFSNNHDDQSRERGGNMPVRQPRGPAMERGSGFSRGRQNGHQARGSDELRQSNVQGIIVE